MRVWNLENDVLKYVARMGEVSVHEILDEFNLDDYTKVNANLGMAVERGYLTKRVDEKSRRRNMFSITPEGRAKIREPQDEHFRV